MNINTDFRNETYNTISSNASPENVYLRKQNLNIPLVSSIVEKINDETISNVWLHLLSLPDGNYVNKTEIRQSLGLGRDKFLRIIKFLREHNLIEHLWIKNPKGQVQKVIMFVKDGSEYLDDIINIQKHREIIARISLGVSTVDFLPSTVVSTVDNKQNKCALISCNDWAKLMPSILQKDSDFLLSRKLSTGLGTVDFDPDTLLFLYNINNIYIYNTREWQKSVDKSKPQLRTKPCKRKKQRLPLPADFFPEPKRYARAVAKCAQVGITFEELLVKFRNLQHIGGRKSYDWQSSFENFVINERARVQKDIKEIGRRPSDVNHKRPPTCFAESRCTVPDYVPDVNNFKRGDPNIARSYIAGIKNALGRPHSTHQILSR